MKKLLKEVNIMALLTAALLAGGLSGQGIWAEDGSHQGSQSGASCGISDQSYIDMSIMHHQQAVEMARLALQKAQSPGVKTIAQQTLDDQQKDIRELQQMRERLGMSGGTADHSGMMKQMQSDMAALQNAQGQEFDKVFLDKMKAHHQAAIDISKQAAESARNKEVKEFARKTVDKQSSEIQEIDLIKASLTKS